LIYKCNKVLDKATMEEFKKAVFGQARTILIAKTTNGLSLCGGYLESAWQEGFVKDPTHKSFVFTLENHPKISPTQFPMNGSDEKAGYVNTVDPCFGFYSDGWTLIVYNKPCAASYFVGYQDTLDGRGPAVIRGGEKNYQIGAFEVWAIQ
jgi:hypothetical protein